MVAPYLDMEGQALGVELGAREDEGWEAMAMRDGLTDAMLHEKFGEVISSEVRTCETRLRHDRKPRGNDALW